MKRIIAIILAALMILGLAACGNEPAPQPTPEPVETAQPTPEPAPEPTPEPFSARATAEKITSLMTIQDFTAVMSYGSTALRNMADANYVSMLWNSTAGTLGSFESINSAMTMEGEYMGYATATVFCEFSDGGLGVTYLFDGDDKLDSFVMNYYTPLDLYAFEGDGSATPLLWEVTSPDGEKMYMFGSYHLAAPDFYPLPDAVMQAYNESDALAVEYDTLAATFDFESLVEMQNAIVYTDGTSAATHLSEETHSLAVEFMTEKGIYGDVLESYNVSQWNTFILQAACQEIGFNSVYGVDSVLLNMAHHEGKKILEVESQAEQLELLTSTSDLYNDASIRSTIEEYEEGKEFLAELFEAYASGDEETLVAMLLDDSFDEDDLNAYTAEQREAIKAEAEEYDSRMMHERNLGMADKAIEYIDSGETVFFVVGLAHMLGEDGLVSLLTEAGYVVEKVIY